jgi:uncharacterized protein YjbI with pentapeptide repeats
MLFLTDVNFQNADLRGTKFTNAIIINVDFRTANLRGMVVNHADMSNNWGISETMKQEFEQQGARFIGESLAEELMTNNFSNC